MKQCHCPQGALSITVLLILIFLIPGSASGQTQVVIHDPCIARIIAMDDSLGSVRNLSTISISLSETIRNYTDALDELDFSDCPKAFTKAFRSHIAAWRRMGAYLNRYSDLRGEMHALFAQIEDQADGPNAEFSKLHDAIWSTWEDVEAAVVSNQ